MAVKQVTCPLCGHPMLLRSTAKYRYPNGKPHKFFGCSRYPDCHATHGAHPNGHPVGIPGDGPTKAARMVAHEAFDALWKSGEMTRKEAYREMQRAFGMTKEEAHIANFDVPTCDRVVAWIESRREGDRR